MTASEIGSLIIQVAPFVGIIILELLRPGFDRRINRVFDQYRDEVTFEEPQKKDFEDYAQYSFDYENAMEHLELTLLALVIVFVGKLVGTTSQHSRTLTGIVLLVAVLFIAAVRYAVQSYFEDRSPHRYRIEDRIAGFRYGDIVVIGSNLFVILLVVASELL